MKRTSLPATLAAVTLAALALGGCAPDQGHTDSAAAPAGVSTDGPAPDAAMLGPGWAPAEDGPQLSDLILCDKAWWPAGEATTNHHFTAPTGEQVTVAYRTHARSPVAAATSAVNDCPVHGLGSTTVISAPDVVDIPPVAFTATSTTYANEDGFRSSRTVMSAPLTGADIGGTWAVAFVDVTTESDGVQVGEFTRRVLAAAVAAKRGEHVNPVAAIGLIELHQMWGEDVEGPENVEPPAPISGEAELGDETLD